MVSSVQIDFQVASEQILRLVEAACTWFDIHIYIRRRATVTFFLSQLSINVNSICFILPLAYWKLVIVLMWHVLGSLYHDVNDIYYQLLFKEKLFDATFSEFLVVCVV